MDPADPAGDVHRPPHDHDLVGFVRRCPHNPQSASGLGAGLQDVGGRGACARRTLLRRAVVAVVVGQAVMF
jgi:hypothetical protein